MSLQRVIPVVIALVLVGCGKEEVTQELEIIQPAKVLVVSGQSNAINRQLPGIVRASQRVDLAFQVPGQLKFFPLKEGQDVTEGEVLGRLDDRDYRSNLSASKAEFTKTKANFKRAEELLVKKFISQVEYDRLKAALDVAISNLEKSKKALEDAELKAPFTGTVAKRYVENFQDVQAKQAIISLQDNSQLEVVVNVSESLVSRRSPKENETLQTTARFEAFPDEEFELFVKEFSTEADSKTQTFEIVLGMKDTKGISLLPGMTAKVFAKKISTLEAGDTFVVPMHAVVADEDENAFVWVVNKNNSVNKKTIAMGELKGKDSIEAIGLAAGDVVVIGGVTKMREGKVIRPIEKVEY